MTITLHQGDIPAGLSFGTSVAVDSEMMGLNPKRDRLCTVQLSAGDGTAHIVQFKRGQYAAPNLKKLLTDKNVVKILHFARADLASYHAHLGILMTPVYCTKTASRLARTFTQAHGLRACCEDLLGIKMDKQQQTTDWGTETLTPEQLNYAASDVLHLHKLKDMLHGMLQREGRDHLIQAVNDFLPYRALLDEAGWSEDIFEH